MLVGIDSYSFHRYFGEIYPGLQTDPGKRWDMADDFLPYALSLGVDEVALETIFFPVMDDGYCAALKERLDEAGIRRVIGWGHPDGLHAGTDHEALADLIRHVPRAEKVGASIMRIVASSMIHVEDPHDPQIDASVAMLRRAAAAAADHGVTLAIENHIDFTAPEMLRIIEGVDSEHLRVNLDTGNALRMYEDPVEAARLLAPYVVTTHTKDIIVRRGGAPSERFPWWPSCPAGEGLVDLHGVARVLHEAGFEGALAIEMDLMAPPWDTVPEEENVAQSIRYLKSVVAALDGDGGEGSVDAGAQR